METSILSPTHKYAAGALFALALHQSQIHQSQSSSFSLSLDEGQCMDSAGRESDNPGLWVHENSVLLLPVFRFLGLDDTAWEGLKETAGASPRARDHVGAYLKLLYEESEGKAAERTDKELALTKAVDATASSAEDSLVSCEVVGKGHEEHFNAKIKEMAEVPQESKGQVGSGNETFKQTLEEGSLISYRRKVTVLYEILSACLADDVDKQPKCTRQVKGYDARYRVAIRLLASWLDVELIKLEALEMMVSYSLMDKSNSDNEKGKEDSKEPSTNWKRGGIVGAAALTGGTLMAVSGGLAAPAIANGLGAVAPTLGSLVPAIGAGGFTAAATATGSVAGSVTVAASFGAAGAGLAGTKMANRTADLEEFEFKEIGENHNQGRLAVEIVVSGLIFEDEDFVRPWEQINESLERYALRWESKNLTALSTVVRDWLSSRLAMELMKDGVMLTTLSKLLTAFALPATLVTAADVIDNKWAIALDRSDKAGKLLAEVLIKGLHGNRPVTLIGFSLGARVIFKCLQFLADTEEDHAGIVERVVLLGTPVAIKDERWEDVRKMVAGRFVNVYSTNDWTLGISCRANLLSQGIAGIQPIDVPGIQNVDVTEKLNGHSCYLTKTIEILQDLDLDNCFPVLKTSTSTIKEDD